MSGSRNQPAGLHVARERTLPNHLGRRIWISARWVVPLLIVVAYGAYLRADALVGKFGPFTHPAWLVAMQDGVAASRDVLVPDGWSWTKQDPPYGRGDPVNYIIFARQMTSFYQAHVREPVFLVGTRAFMTIAGNQDVAVSLASAAFSTIAIWATFLLGSAVANRAVGLAAAALAAVERDLVTWAPDGWRDDAFTAMVALCAWAFIRLHQRETWPRAVVLGVIAAAACLTRITSLSFVLPAFAILFVTRAAEDRRRRIGQVALAAALAAALVAPYLINCYRVTGDAFFAINEHTRFYRASQRLPYDKPMGALAYTAMKFRLKPVAETDTAFRGLFVYALSVKSWRIASWPPATRAVLTWLAVLGLTVWLWQPGGRIALLVLHASLIPYMLTWALPGGSEWRFTMHTYPFYCAAAAAAVWATGSLAASRTRGRLGAIVSDRRARARLAIQIAALAVVALAGRWWYTHGPVFVLAEALRAGEDVSVQTGPNDGVFFREGWSGLSRTGAVVSRFATGQTAVVSVPLPERRPYRLGFRLDPLPADTADETQRVTVWLGDRRLADLDLTLNPERVGNYPVAVPADLAGGGLTTLRLTAQRIRRAGAQATHYAALTPDMPVAFMMWYIRVTPE